nr:glycoprotein vIgFam2.5 [Elephant endotheliotropic herpesvirus 1A]
MNLWVVRRYLVDYIYIYVYVLLNLSNVISKIHVGQNITFGLNDSTCNNPATVTWLYNNEFIANWSTPNVTYPKTVRKSVNLTNPCSLSTTQHATILEIIPYAFVKDRNPVDVHSRF